jgi:hypothetical protein
MIDWPAMDPNCLAGYSRLQWICTETEAEKQPKNLALLAERLDESKLFGYFDHSMKLALMELSRCLIPYEVDGAPGRPKLYFDIEFEEDIGMLEFVPGTSTVYISAIPSAWIEEEMAKEGIKEGILEVILERLTKKIEKECID